MIHFIADTHFSHNNILKYEPMREKVLARYKDINAENIVSKMNEMLIEGWNNTIQKSDTVFFLGDFCFNNDAEDFLKRLNGYFIFIKGNHDKRISQKKFEEALQHRSLRFSKEPIAIYDGMEYSMSEIMEKNIGVILSHEPIYELPSGILNIHGHIHSKELKEPATHFCVSVERNENLLPFSFNHICYESGLIRNGNIPKFVTQLRRNNPKAKEYIIELGAKKAKQKTLQKEISDLETLLCEQLGSV